MVWKQPYNFVFYLPGISVADPNLNWNPKESETFYWIRIQIKIWIRIRIRIQTLHFNSTAWQIKDLNVKEHMFSLLQNFFPSYWFPTLTVLMQLKVKCASIICDQNPYPNRYRYRNPNRYPNPKRSFVVPNPNPNKNNLDPQHCLESCTGSTYVKVV
jgi:hypothetical protein